VTASHRWPRHLHKLGAYEQLTAIAVKHTVLSLLPAGMDKCIGHWVGALFHVHASSHCLCSQPAAGPLVLFLIYTAAGGMGSGEQTRTQSLHLPSSPTMSHGQLMLTEAYALTAGPW
jgi:hypothetical protein